MKYIEVNFTVTPMNETACDIVAALTAELALGADWKNAVEGAKNMYMTQYQRLIMLETIAVFLDFNQ
jgi:hydroxymethylpyrimidine/phosphomethylpyrimidine kinase